MIKDSKILNASLWLENKIAVLYILVVLFFYGFILSVIVNIPYNDDHSSMFGFLFFFEERGWKSIFAQHNEHRIAFIKLLLLVDQYLTTSINITHYIWLGVISLVGVAKIIYVSFEINNNKLLYFFPFFLLLFMPVSEMHNWGMATFINVTVVFFVYLSFYFLYDKSNLNLIIAIMFSILATFSNGAGIFVYPIGILLLVAKNRWCDLFVWLTAAAIILCKYFKNYVTPAYKSTAIQERIEHIDQVIMCSFRFMGGSFESLIYSPPYLTIAGMTITIFFIVVFFNRWEYFKKNPLMLSFLFFIVLSAGAASLSRGCASAVTARMSLSHVLGLGLIYLCSIEAYPYLSKKILKLIIVFSVFFYVVRLHKNIPKMIKHKERLNASYLSYLSGDINYIDSWTKRNPKLIKETLDRSIKDETYLGPTKVVPIPQLYSVAKLRELSVEAKVQFSRYHNGKKGLIIHGNAFIDGKSDDFKKQVVSAILWSDKIAYKISAEKYKYYRPSIAKALNKKHKAKINSKFPIESSFYFHMPKQFINILDGEYKISILIEEGNEALAVKHFNKVVSFPFK